MSSRLVSTPRRFSPQGLRIARTRRQLAAHVAAGGREATWDAFISYSRAVDGRLAPALQYGLHRFARPWNRLRALRVFRDDASLSANPGLWSSIERALNESRFLILLASPESARSEWVGREVAFWLEVRSYESVLVALTGGEPMDALPPALVTALPEEPRYVDLRWARDANDVSLRNIRFRDTVADLAATVHGRPKDEMIGEDVRQHRRTLRIARAAGVTLFVALAIAVASAVVAVEQRNTARDERNTALSRLLASRAQTDLDRRLDRAALTSLEAMRLADTNEARASAYLAVQRSEPRRDTLTVPGGGLSALAFSPDGALLAVAGNQLSLFDVRNGQRMAAPRAKTPVFKVAFVGDELAWADGDGSLTFWNHVTRQRRAGPRIFDARDIAIAGGVLIDARGVDIQISDAQDLNPPVRLDRPGEEVRALALTDDGRLLAATRGTNVELFDTTTGRRLGAPLRGHQQDVTAVAFSREGSMLASGSFDRGIRLWRIGEDGGSPAGALEGHTATVRALAFSPDGTVLVSGGSSSPGVTGGILRLWDVRAQRALGGSMPALQTEVLDVEFSPDGKYLATAEFGGRVALWEPSLWATDAAALERRLCQVAGRNLTEAEWQTLSTGQEYTRTCENLPAGNPIAAMPDRFAGAYDAVAVHDEPVTVVLRGIGDPTCRRLLARAATCFTMRPTGWNIVEGFDPTYGEVFYRNGQLLLRYEYVGGAVPTSCVSELDSYRPAKDRAWALLARLAIGDANSDCTVHRLQPTAQ